MKSLLAIVAMSALVASPAKADKFKLMRKCNEQVVNASFEKQYAKGKEHAQLFETALNRKDWNKEDQQYTDLSGMSSQHGLGGLTGRAEMLAGMLLAKSANEEWSIDSDYVRCLMGEFKIYGSQACQVYTWAS